MNEYKKKLFQIVLPFAIAQKTKNIKFLYELADKVYPSLPIYTCKSISLKNIGQSCYIDSVLIALFSVPTHITYNILNKSPQNECQEKVQTNLKNLENIDRITCLRDSFKNCENLEDFSTPGEKDAGEFLDFLFDIFSTETHVSVKLFQTIAGNKIISSRLDRFSSPIQYISADELKERKNPIYISSLLKKENQLSFDKDNLYRNQYSDIITTEEILKSSLIVFSVNRKDPFTDIFISKSINITETLTITNGERFALVSIVIYTDHHYIVYYKCNNTWYEYDDLRGKSFIGSFQNLLEKDPNPETNGVLYFYFPLYMFIDEIFLFQELENKRGCDREIIKDLVVGVFEDEPNQKINSLKKYYNAIKISKKLFNMGTGLKSNNKPTLYILTIDEYVKLL